MKIVVITGANTGIGFATAQAFIQDGQHVILACRNPQKAEHARTELEKLGTGKVEVIALDLNSLQNIQDTANSLLQKYEKIDVLVNNAGIMTPNLERTDDGFEKQIGVNYLGHFLWTLKLLPAVQKSEAGRIINLASMMHLMGSIQLNQFRADDVHKYNGVIRYGNSKLANLLFSHTLAEKLKGTSTTSNALHPGGVDSEIYRELPKYQYKMIKLFLIPPTKPAELIKKMALDPAWAKRNGEYVSLQAPAIQSSKAKNKKLAHELYDATYAMLKDYL